MFPDLYQAYILKVKKLGHQPSKRLVRYATRYKFAGQIASIDLLDASSEAQQAYTLALRISLGYSAFETLSKHLNANDLPIVSVIAAQALKTKAAISLREYLFAESQGKILRSLERFYSSPKDSNIAPVVTAIRHSMFHGQFNPSAAGAKSKASQSVLAKVDQALFTTMNRLSKPIFEEALKISA